MKDDEKIMKEQHGLLMVQVEPDPKMVEEFEAWYETEHIPERLSVPGILCARRFIRESKPRFAAFYDLASVDVLDSPGYRVYFEGKRRTAWTARVGGRLVKVDRRSYSQVYPGTALPNAEHTEAAALRLSIDLETATEHVKKVRDSANADARLFKIGPSPKSDFEKKFAPDAWNDDELLVLYSANDFETIKALASEISSDSLVESKYSALGGLRFSEESPEG